MISKKQVSTDRTVQASLSGLTEYQASKIMQRLCSVFEITLKFKETLFKTVFITA